MPQSEVKESKTQAYLRSRAAEFRATYKNAGISSDDQFPEVRTLFRLPITRENWALDWKITNLLSCFNGLLFKCNDYQEKEIRDICHAIINDPYCKASLSSEPLILLIKEISEKISHITNIKKILEAPVRISLTNRSNHAVFQGMLARLKEIIPESLHPDIDQSVAELIKEADIASSAAGAETESHGADAENQSPPIRKRMVLGVLFDASLKNSFEKLGRYIQSKMLPNQPEAQQGGGAAPR